MFFTLSKLVYGLIMPISLVLIVFILGFFIRKRKRLTNYIALGLLIFFTNPFFSGIAMNLWEVSPFRYDQIENRYEFGVLLTGITDPLKMPDDRTHFNKGSDRVIHTLELYKKGIIKKIIISGGSGSLLHKNVSESVSLQSFLILAGVPNEDITIETRSRNTHENALYTNEILQKLDGKQKVLVITSAFHMRRTQGCFEKVGVEFDSFPTDYYSGPLGFTPDELIIPNVDALKEWTILFKEWIGYSAYSVVGYI